MNPIDDLIQSLAELRGTIRVIAGQAMDPDDLHQDVALRVLSRLARGAAPRDMRDYIAVAARNRVAELSRQYIVRQEPEGVPSLDVFQTDAGSPVLGAAVRERKKLVRAAVRMLPENHRVALRDRYWRGKTLDRRRNVVAWRSHEKLRDLLHAFRPDRAAGGVA